MKKIFLLFTVALSVLLLVACDNRPALKVLMPTEYIDLELVKEFNKAGHDFKVEIITFDSNEDMLATVQDSNYDIIIPSDYALEELSLRDGFLKEIDWTRLEHLTNKTGFDSDLVSALESLNTDENPFDLLKYGIPYFWGSVGLLYDTNKISTERIQEEGWNILKTADRVMGYDSARDAMMIALKQGYLDADTQSTSSVNTATEADINNAANWWKSSKVSLYQTDQIFDDMMHPTKFDVAVAYSGDALYIIDKNIADGHENIDYYVPTDAGSNIFIDAMVITSASTKIDEAYTFINFITDPENAYTNSYEVAYTSPYASVVERIIENEDYPENVYRVTFGDFDELFRYNKTLGDQVVQAWINVKAK